MAIARHTGAKATLVELDSAPELRDPVRVERLGVREERFAHLPELSLLARAARRARRTDGQAMRGEREIAHGVAQLPGVDEIALDAGECRCVVLLAERALVVGELDHRERRIGPADDRAAHRADACDRVLGRCVAHESQAHHGKA